MSIAAELAIRSGRAAFNRALANADLDGVARMLAPDAILVTGTDSAVISGRKAQLATWKREFGASARTVYTRTPETIAVSPVEPIAFEQGSWTGVLQPGGQELARGSYVAKWREFASGWLIEAELYLTLA
ncbi:nuclear transport factor 2 family protein [Sphingomonas sp.]|uniref:nuclear transport factor 2 family protein n=1 Tax=Sphingomonas sp. TaxID=28214 RepID=UPI000DB327CE|nr:nuclear transport factor 2 family protein [Sphingomonas sp.]PZU06859.1 MAG: DUF4440 domain-containing protein [Sphingomonas sp.]